MPTKLSHLADKNASSVPVSLTNRTALETWGLPLCSREALTINLSGNAAEGIKTAVYFSNPAALWFTDRVPKEFFPSQVTFRKVPLKIFSVSFS